MSRSLKSFPELPLKLLAIGTIAETNVSLQDAVEVLREQVGKKPRFNDDHHRRLAAKAKKIGLERLKSTAAIATPRALLAWHQRLIACKYDC